MRIHPARSFSNYIEDQFHIVIAPSLHLPVRVDDGKDVIGNIILLFAFFMNCNSGVSRQWLENSFEVNFRPASGTYLQKTLANEVLYEVKDYLP